MRHTVRILVLAATAALAPLATAQVYKWTDDKGVVNYSNTPPADKAKKGVSVVEDRVSVYSADPAVVQATQNARARRAVPEPPQQAAVIQRPPAPVPPVATADPCVNGYDPVNCDPYYGSTVFAGRRRPPNLIQPQLPPGVTAGNVNAGTGFTPGLSTQAQLGAQPPVTRPARQQSGPLLNR